MQLHGLNAWCMHYGPSAPLSVGTESSKVTFPSSWALCWWSWPSPKDPRAQPGLWPNFQPHVGKERVDQATGAFPPGRENKLGVGCPSAPQGAGNHHPDFKPAPTGRGHAPMGGRSPLAMVCQGCQPLLLPFSSLFYKFSRFLQVGINPSQGRMGGWQLWGTAATSLPVPGAMGRKDSPTHLFGHQLMSCKICLCTPDPFSRCDTEPSPLLGA